MLKSLSQGQFVNNVAIDKDNSWWYYHEYQVHPILHVGPDETSARKLR
jgi:hypothetical protein